MSGKGILREVFACSRLAGRAGLAGARGESDPSPWSKPYTTTPEFLSTLPDFNVVGLDCFCDKLCVVAKP